MKHEYSINPSSTGTIVLQDGKDFSLINVLKKLNELPAEDLVEQYLMAAIDRSPQQLKRLGDWLANVLDEAEWKTAERLLLGLSTEFNFREHLYRQRKFSEATFGPGKRTAGVVDHIRKELLEVEAAPGDITEWIDVAILALDGAWRAGATPEQIIDTLVAKQTKNEGRSWPDWRTAEPDKAIQHVKMSDEYGNKLI